MNMNMNINMNGRRRRNAGNKSLMTELFAPDENNLSKTLQNVDLHNYCEGRVSTNLSLSIHSCSEEITEETIIKTFSLMHEYFNNEKNFETCLQNKLNRDDQKESLIDKIIMSTFQDEFM